jgi:hypothetical protein
MIVSFGEDFSKDIFIFLKEDLTLERFLAKCHVRPNSFAAKEMERIFCCLTSELTCLNNYYTKFYYLDYDDFLEFMKKKYFVPDSFLQSYKDIQKDLPDIKIYHKSQYSQGDYVVEQFIFSETMLEKIQNVLKEIIYEN